jgi:hypothetical protein
MTNIFAVKSLIFSLGSSSVRGISSPVCQYCGLTNLCIIFSHSISIRYGLPVDFMAAVVEV